MLEIQDNLRISVIIPAYNEESRIEQVIFAVRDLKEIDEVIVVDDGSTDRTRDVAKRSGVRVVSVGKNRGKGYAMKLGASRATGDILIFLDADQKNIDSKKIKVLIDPFKKNFDFVKTRFDRNSGRVTLLTAKPLLEHFFPEIAKKFDQPLSGQIAIKKDIFDKITLENDYGVDIGILIDVVEMGAKTCQVYFGYLEHNEKALENLDLMARQVTRVILDRASKYKKTESLVNPIQP